MGEGKAVAVWKKKKFIRLTYKSKIKSDSPLVNYSEW